MDACGEHRKRCWMAKRKVYTDEQKQEALAVYKEKNARAASEATGIPLKTIASWAARAGLTSDANEKRIASRDKARLHFEARRENLKVLMVKEAERCLVDMSGTVTTITKNGEVVTHPPTPKDRQALGTTFGILFDKIQLATGRPTSNTTTADISLRPLLDAVDEDNDEKKAELLRRQQELMNVDRPAD